MDTAATIATVYSVCVIAIAYDLIIWRSRRKEQAANKAYWVARDAESQRLHLEFMGWMEELRTKGYVAGCVLCAAREEDEPDE